MDAEKVARVGGPVRRGWQEGTLTRAKELESLAAWVRGQIPPADYAALGHAIAEHLDAAREAARAGPTSRGSAAAVDGPAQTRAAA
jgi:hypothetical protein